MYYKTNGTSTDVLPENAFYVEELTADYLPSGTFYFPGDEIFFKIENNVQKYSDLFIEKTIDPETYEKYYYNIPIVLLEVGLNSDYTESKESFINFMEKPSPIYEKLPQLAEIDSLKPSFAYIADCHALIHSFQNMIMESKLNFSLFYKYLSQIKTKNDEEGVYWIAGGAINLPFKFAQSVFIDIASAFDLLTKILYELEHLRDVKDEYQKLASADILFGKNIIRTIAKEDTIYETNKDITTLLAVRNEIIHNGSWEPLQKVYYVISDRKPVERFILFPDLTEEGALDTYKSRKRFYSKQTKLNEILLELYFTWLERINKTLESFTTSYV